MKLSAKPGNHLKLENVIIDQIRFHAFGGGLISRGGSLYSDVFFVYR